jgi:hypothetical protein
MPEIAIVGDGTNVSIQAVNSKESTGDVFNINFGSTDKTFRVIFKLENVIKIMSDNYDIKISSKGISHWAGREIEYWVAFEKGSTF